MPALKSLIRKAATVSVIVAAAAAFTFAQKAVAKPVVRPASSVKLPIVKQIDTAGLKELLKVNKKPLLINFWATWCDPCREEFPDLVKINAEYGENLDFLTISLDDLAEIRRDVPKFLAEMKATMPAYLLKAEDENDAIGVVSKDWKGGLPFTILFDERGEVSYVRQGKINVETVRAKLDLLTSSKTAGTQN